MYPNYLSQAVFTAFYKAFPQSLPQFNGEFKSEIVDLIFQWVSGKYKTFYSNYVFSSWVQCSFFVL